MGFARPWLWSLPEERSNPATSGVWLALHSSTPLILALEQATSPFKEWTTERLFWVISKAEARLVQQLLLISPTQRPDTQIVLSGYRYAVQSKLMWCMDALDGYWSPFKSGGPSRSPWSFRDFCRRGLVRSSCCKFIIHKFGDQNLLSLIDALFGNPDNGKALPNINASKVDTFCATGDLISTIYLLWTLHIWTTPLTRLRLLHLFKITGLFRGSCGWRFLSGFELWG